MIIDQSQLAGDDAYLRDGGHVDLGGATGRTGRSPELGKGMLLRVTAVSLFVEADDLGSLFARQSNPLLRLELRKEMFPGLVRDPNASRVHTIGGFEDFARGDLRGLEALEVDGTAALVSVGAGGSRWLSPVYRMPRPVDLAAAAWEMPSSPLASRGFVYTLALRFWPHDLPLSQPPEERLLAEDAGPGDPRFVGRLGPSDNADAIEKIASYQLAFGAHVDHDAYLRERLHGSPDAPSRGRPLLSSVHLLERVDSPFVFRSLQEVVASAWRSQLLDGDGGPSRRLSASIALPAALGVGERIELRVAGGSFSHVEARLEGTQLVRPPLADKAR